MMRNCAVWAKGKAGVLLLAICVAASAAMASGCQLDARKGILIDYDNVTVGAHATLAANVSVDMNSSAPKVYPPVLIESKDGSAVCTLDDARSSALCDQRSFLSASEGKKLVGRLNDAGPDLAGELLRLMEEEHVALRNHFDYKTRLSQIHGQLVQLVKATGMLEDWDAPGVFVIVISSKHSKWALRIDGQEIELVTLVPAALYMPISTHEPPMGWTIEDQEKYKLGCQLEALRPYSELDRLIASASPTLLRNDLPFDVKQAVNTWLFHPVGLAGK